MNDYTFELGVGLAFFILILSVLFAGYVLEQQRTERWTACLAATHSATDCAAVLH